MKHVSLYIDIYVGIYSRRGSFSHNKPSPARANVLIFRKLARSPPPEFHTGLRPPSFAIKRKSADVARSRNALRKAAALTRPPAFLSSCRVISHAFCKVVCSRSFRFSFPSTARAIRAARMISRRFPLADRRRNFRRTRTEIPCERTMISKFALPNGRRCRSTRETTPELNVVGTWLLRRAFFQRTRKVPTAESRFR